MPDNETKAATKTDEKAVLAHLADPLRNPLPAGVAVNFGDPEPIRQTTKDELAAPAPAANAADHHPVSG